MISPSDYLDIATNIALYVRDTNSSVTALAGAQTTLDSMVGDDDLKTPLDTALSNAQYFIGTLASNPQNIASAVRTLNLYVQTQYGDLNNFLSNSSISVPAEFATISATVGFTINPGSIA